MDDLATALRNPGGKKRDLLDLNTNAYGNSLGRTRQTPTPTSRFGGTTTPMGRFGGTPTGWASDDDENFEAEPHANVPITQKGFLDDLDKPQESQVREKSPAKTPNRFEGTSSDREKVLDTSPSTKSHTTENVIECEPSIQENLVDTGAPVASVNSVETEKPIKTESLDHDTDDANTSPSSRGKLLEDENENLKKELATLKAQQVNQGSPSPHPHPWDEEQ